MIGRGKNHILFSSLVLIHTIFGRTPLTRSLYSSLIKSYAGGTDKPTDIATYRLNRAAGHYSAKSYNMQQEEIFTKVYIELAYSTGESVQVMKTFSPNCTF